MEFEVERKAGAPAWASGNPIKSIDLERVKIGFVQRFPADADLSSFFESEEAFGEFIAVKLIAHLPAETLEEISVEYPADWWQAIKARFAPKWFLRYYPINNKRTVLKAQAVCPYLNLPRERNFIYLMKEGRV